MMSQRLERTTFVDWFGPKDTHNGSKMPPRHETQSD